MDKLSWFFNMILGMKNTLEGRNSKALYYLQRSKKQNPNGFWSGYFLTYTYDKQGKFTECLAEARSLVRDFPDKYRSYVALANALGRIGEYESSTEALDKIISLSRPRSSNAKKALKGKIDNLVLLNRVEDAERIAKDYHIKWDKQSEIARLSVDPKIDDAERLYYGGDKEGAKSMLEDILRKNPDHVLSLILLGIYYTEINRSDLALEYLLRAVRLDPKGVVPLSDLARTYYNLGNTKLAAKYAKKAIKRNPGFGLPYTVLANVYEKSKRPGIKMNVAQLRREAAMRGDPK